MTSAISDLRARPHAYEGEVGGPPRAVVLKWWAPEDAATVVQPLRSGGTIRIRPTDVDVQIGDSGELSVTIRGPHAGHDQAVSAAGTVMFSTSHLADPAQHPSQAPAWVQTAIAQAQTIAATIRQLGGSAS